MKKKQDEVLSLEDVEVGELIKAVQGRGYYIAKTPLQKSGLSFKGDLKRWAGRKYKFGVVSDTHLASRYQQLTHLNEFYSLCARRKIDTVFHCGDLVDGQKMYRGQEYELFVHGADAQTEYAVSNYPKRKGIQTRMISGNHDQSFLSDAGYNIVEKVCREREDMTYLGDDLAFVTVDSIRIALMHGRSGVPYARSYRIQKIIEQLSSENKPHFLFLGHYHVPSHTPGYRNVEGVQMSCFQAQTPYLVAKGLYPFLAGLIVTVQVDNNGISSSSYEWIPFFKTIKNDY